MKREFEFYFLQPIAAQEGHDGVAKLLLASGADPNRADRCGRTALKVRFVLFLKQKICFLYLKRFIFVRVHPYSWL